MKRVQRALITSSIVLIVGIAAATYTYVAGYQKQGQLESESEREKRLFDFGRIHVARIELKNKHGLIIFERGPHADWRLISPLAWPADQAAVTMLVDHMATIKAEVDVTQEAKPEQLKAYGLDQPQIQLSATLKSGAQHELLVGKKHNFENGYYVSDAKNKRIGIAVATFYDVFTRDLKSFRAKQLIPFPAKQIQELTVFNPKDRVYELKRNEKKWTVNDKPADADYIARLLLVLTRDLRSESFDTDKLDKNNLEEMKAYGLDQPKFRLRLKLKDGKTLEALISAGPDVLNGKGPFLHLLGTKTVISVYENFVHDIDKSPEKFRDRTISKFDHKTVSQIKFRFSDGRRAEITKIKDKWGVVGQSGKAAKPWKIDALLRVFSNLKSDEIVTDKASVVQREQWQLNNPIHEISFWDAQNKSLADVQIGKRSEDTKVFISARGLARVDAIAAERLAGFPASIDALIED